MKDQATEATIAAAAQKVTFGAGTAAVYGGLTANELAAFGGLIVAVIGLLIQWHYKRKDDRRRIELHRAEIDLRRAQMQELNEYGADGP